MGSYLKKQIDDAVNRRLESAMAIAKQATFDAVCVALNREFGFGEQRLLKLAETSCSIYEELVDALNGKDDMDATFTQLDRELQQFLPTAFEPYDIRYGDVLKLFSYKKKREQILKKYGR